MCCLRLRLVWNCGATSRSGQSGGGSAECLEATSQVCRPDPSLRSEPGGILKALPLTGERRWPLAPINSLDPPDSRNPSPPHHSRQQFATTLFMLFSALLLFILSPLASPSIPSNLIVPQLKEEHERGLLDGCGGWFGLCSPHHPGCGDALVSQEAVRTNTRKTCNHGESPPHLDTVARCQLAQLLSARL